MQTSRNAESKPKEENIMKRMNGRWLLTALLLAALAQSGCSSGSGSSTDATATTDGTTATVDPGAPPAAVGSPGTTTPAAKAMVVTGTVVGDANAALTGAAPVGVTPTPGTPASVPLAAPVSVVLVDDTAQVVASQTVTAADCNFVLIPPPGHTYVLLLRDAATGKTLAPMFADDKAGRISFSVPVGASDFNLGNITFDSLLGKAWTWAHVVLPPPAVAFPFTLVEWRGTADVPTERAPSPLFGALPFTQEMMLFEEFGPEPMPLAAQPGFTPLPQPQNAQNGPVPTQVEAFLAQTGVAPYPTEFSNVIDVNPWKSAIEASLGHALVAPPGSVAGPAEGRPGGADWSHQ